MTHLKENLANNTVCFLTEHGREDDSDAIMRSLNVDRLLVTIVYSHQLTLAGPGALEGFLLRERPLEWSSQCVSL